MGQMNVLYPPFDNVKIRRAAMLALGQNDVLAALIGNPEYFAACPSMYGCGVPLSTDAGAPKTFATGDIKAAQQALLKEAGYDGTPVVILQPTDVITVAPQPVVAAQALRNAGFKVTLQPMDWQTLVTRRASQPRWPKADGACSSPTGSAPKSGRPSSTPCSTRVAEGRLLRWLDDPEIIKMREEFAAAKTLDEQKAVATKIQQRAYDDAAYVPLGSYYIPALLPHLAFRADPGTGAAVLDIKKAN